MQHRLHDVDELVGVKGVAAHEHAVHIGACGEKRGIAGLDGAAVEHVAALGAVLPRDLGHRCTNLGGNVLHILGRGNLARTDGPNGLIGNGEVATCQVKPSKGSGTCSVTYAEVEPAS